MISNPSENRKNYLVAIGLISVAVPLLVTVLLFLPDKEIGSISWVSMLPHLNAVINSLTALILIGGFYWIKRKNIEYHKLHMVSAFILGILFLIFYIVYHAFAPSTIFGDFNGDGTLSELERKETGIWRNIYLGLLLSHILMALVVVPFVLLALYYALTRNFDRHKMIVKFAWPTWLFVSISGVVVYFLIRPFY